jgi:hypothetical protein
VRIILPNQISRATYSLARHRNDSKPNKTSLEWFQSIQQHFAWPGLAKLVAIRASFKKKAREKSNMEDVATGSNDEVIP